MRMSYYRIVLAEGQHDDLIRYLNRGLLISLCPTLRTLISRDVREVWERSFDELAHSAQAVRPSSSASTGRTPSGWPRTATRTPPRTS
ncbi:hypothetical protein GCM10010518_52110 [Kitasatospora cinereorecta]